MNCRFIWLSCCLLHIIFGFPPHNLLFTKAGIAMINFTNLSRIAAFSVVLVASVASSQATMPPAGFAVPTANSSYADIADLVVISPLIVDATVRKTIKIPAEQAIGVPANLQRMLIVADVSALVRGNDGVAGQVRFLLDVPKDAKGKIPKLKKQRYFLLGNKAAGLPGTIRLSRPDAMVEWSVDNDAMLRAITKEAVVIDAPRPIVAVTSAFHSPGTIIGEGETQIFVEAKGNQIYSLSVFSQPGAPKRWAVSTGEVIDESAGAPEKNSLLWYRLACGLPQALDAKLVESPEADSATKARADYRFIIASLGPCDRTRRR